MSLNSFVMSSESFSVQLRTILSSTIKGSSINVNRWPSSVTLTKLKRSLNSSWIGFMTSRSCSRPSFFCSSVSAWLPTMNMYGRCFRSPGFRAEETNARKYRRKRLRWACPKRQLSIRRNRVDMPPKKRACVLWNSLWPAVSYTMIAPPNSGLVAFWTTIPAVLISISPSTPIAIAMDVFPDLSSPMTQSFSCSGFLSLPSALYKGA